MNKEQGGRMAARGPIQTRPEALVKLGGCGVSAGKLRSVPEPLFTRSPGHSMMGS
jgi:hypothetical protein